MIIGADRASREFELKALEAAGIGWQDEVLEQELGLDHPENAWHLKHNQSLTPRGRIFEHLKENKYQYVLGGWAASMVGSFGFVAAQPLSLTQKLIQARMYAQGLTVAVVMVSATLASLSTEKNGGVSNKEAQARRESAMYKFKSDSPHQIEAERLRHVYQEHKTKDTK